MNLKKYLFGINLLVIISFLLLSCSTQQNDQSDNSQPAKTLKAKIVYFSIPG